MQEKQYFCKQNFIYVYYIRKKGKLTMHNEKYFFIQK